MISGLTLSGALSLLFRFIVVGVSAVAFGLSGTGKWAGNQLPISLGPPEYMAGGIAMVIMLVVIATKRNSAAIPRNVYLAVIGTLLHIPAILGESSASWANVVPSQLTELFADSAMTESMLVATFLTLITASILAFIVDSSSEETLDLQERGLGEQVVKAVVKEATILKLATLLVGLVIGLGIQGISLAFGSSLGEQTSVLPVAIAGLGGVLAITVPIVLYFENRTARSTDDEIELEPTK
jgi:hypothetical protein